MKKTILRHFFEKNGIFVVFTNGETLFEATPSGLTAAEHFQKIQARQ